MDFIFGEELAKLATNITPFITPTNTQIRTWLQQTEGRIDKEVCQFLNMKYISNYIYTGNLTVEQRAYIYHIIND